MIRIKNIAKAAGVAAFAFLASSPSLASSPIREVKNGFEVSTGKGIVAVQPLSNDIFRVTALPQGSLLKYRPSQAAILHPTADLDIRTGVTPEAFFFYSPTTTVRIDRESGQVTFHDAAGNLLLSETGGVDNSGDVKTVTFVGDPQERFYGAGERGHRQQLNGDSLTMYNRQNYGYTAGDPRISQMGISVPYVVSDRGYGVLFDDYNEALLVLGDTIKYESATPQPLSYYFINGNRTLAGATEGYTLLTGRQDLPPFWSLGYITSKYGYHNEKEALGVVDTLKTRGYPVDGIVLDLYWYGVETDMGRLEWDPKQWPNHKAMLDSLREKNVNMVLISQPYVNKIGALDNYNYLSERGMLAKDSLGNTHDVTTWVGDAGMIDVSNPATREWLWGRLKGLTEEGVTGWWGDLGEPEVHPRSIVHDNGETAPQYHNVYGNEWSRLIYEGLRKDFPEMRPLLMMRGGTAGLQRYSVFPWTTDVSRSWGGFQPQVNLMLSSGLSGLAYMSSDLGGFAVDPAHPRDEELYVRWVQTGAFTPSMRTHAQLDPEPFHYPAVEQIAKDYILMRYRWLPYNYTLAFENATKGWPLVRSLNFTGENPEERFADVPDEYMWGSEVLVAPVMEPGAVSRKVLFPEGRWYDWFDTSKVYDSPQGGLEATVDAPLDKLPLFIKAGSFIPQYDEKIENVEQYNPERLTVWYFPSEEQTEYVLFDDDRHSPTSLQDGAFQLTTFRGKGKDRQEAEVRIEVEAEGRYEGMPPIRIITFKIPNIPAPSSVTLNDNPENPDNINYDPSSRTLTATFTWSYTPTTLTVTFP